MEILTEVVLPKLKKKYKVDWIEEKREYSGRIQVCLDCDFYSILCGSAREHSKQAQHFVREAQVWQFVVAKENVERLRQALKDARRE